MAIGLYKIKKIDDLIINIQVNTNLIIRKRCISYFKVAKKLIKHMDDSSYKDI